MEVIVDKTTKYNNIKANAAIACVIQWIECQTSNLEVQGSSPCTGCVLFLAAGFLVYIEVELWLG